MTQQPNQQEYWQIQLPLAQFPKSKFQFGDYVAIHGEDDLGNHYCEMGYFRHGIPYRK